jgi:hypothetical protein
VPIPSYLLSLSPYEGLPEINELLFKARAVYEQAPISIESVESLRRALLGLLDKALPMLGSDASFFSAYTSFFWGAAPVVNDISTLTASQLSDLKSALILGLRALSEAYPLNSDDLIDGDAIVEDDIVLHSLRGQQYRLSCLAMWIQHKKDFIYPDMSVAMYADDVERFKGLCELHGVSYAPLNDHQLEMVHALDEMGWSLDELRSLHAPELRINHIRALKKLINEHQLDKEHAFLEIENLNYEQAEAISTLYERGLRGHHLRGLMFDESEFMPHHTAVLQYLLDEKGYDIDSAVALISTYPGEEVETLYFNIPRV